MSKRFFDTGIWMKPWFRKLGPFEKSAWFYITQCCDNVGVWDADFQLAEFSIGGKVDWDTLRDNCNNNIEILACGKCCLVDYCQFQHGDLFSRKASPVIDSFLSLLEKHGLTDRVRQQYANSAVTVIGLGLGKGTGKGKGLGDGDAFDTFWTAYPKKVCKKPARTAWDARMKEKVSPADLMTALANYTKSMAGKDVQFVLNPSTFLGPNERWKDYLTTGSKYVPASAATVNDKWVCSMCEKEYAKSVPRFIGGVCKACKDERV